MRKISTYIKDPLQIFFGLIKRVQFLFKDDARYLQIIYYLNTHHRLDLKNPTTFTEKLQWLKLYNRRPEYTMIVDKYAVKEYVGNIIGKEYVIPTLGVWEKPEDIDIANLPEEFVLKTTHGGGSCGVVICRGKSSFDMQAMVRKLNKSLKQDIYKEMREWPYKNVKKQIIAEPLLKDDKDGFEDLVDYKFYCFDGEPKFCQVILGRNSKETIDFFDMEWHHQEFVGLNPEAGPAAVCPQMPKNFDDMKRIAECLSQNNPFLRVDLYEVNEKVYFGEMTFYPASGLGRFTPEDWDYKMGEWLELPSKINV